MSLDEKYVSVLRFDGSLELSVYETSVHQQANRNREQFGYNEL